jgi:phosphoribosylamine--glycine ligase
MDIFKKAGIEVPVFKEFAKPAEAIKYVKKEMRGFVAKPCYDEADKNLTYLGKTPEALVGMLEKWEREQRLKGPFILQELVDGVEMAVGGWFGPGGFNQGWCENWEEKKLFPGGLGPSTGEMGTVVRYCRKSSLADKVLAPLSEMIEETGHVGYVDVNCIVDDSGTPWPLEFTMRNGYPTWNIQQQLHEGDLCEWLADLAEGRDSRCFDYDKVAVGVVMAQGDFPFSKLATKEVLDFPIYGLADCDGEVHLCQAQAGEAWTDQDGTLLKTPCVTTAGDYVLVACGAGETVSLASKRAYKVLDKIKMPNGAFWRNDIGKRLAKELPRLQANGFAKDLAY